MFMRYPPQICKGWESRWEDGPRHGPGLGPGFQVRDPHEKSDLYLGGRSLPLPSPIPAPVFFVQLGARVVVEMRKRKMGGNSLLLST